MSGPKPETLNSILATDCGSTTTKAILIERRGDAYRLIVRGEAPTTVEAPFEDVTRGVLNAIREVEELRGRPILDGERIITPQAGDRGVDLYVSTSSAGGGLQMMVTGVVKQMTGESAQRAALGAGAIVMDVIASNDGRLPHEKIRRIRHLRPDMILLSGGTDGGTTQHVVEVAELIAAAEPKARLGAGYDMPVIFAGNKDAAPLIQERLGDKTALVITDNLRPSLERENLGPARDKIHDLFMEHVMAHAPGYGKLLTWTPVPVMPTPSAVGDIIHTIAKEEGIADEEIHRFWAESIARADALLYGRVVYEMMQSAWRLPLSPQMPEWTLPFARTIDAAKKYVVSNTLKTVDWNAELLCGDLATAVERLKKEPGQGIATGGVTLPLALAKLGLIDEYEFVVTPRIAGHGPTLFAGLSKRLDLKLVDRQDLGLGRVALRYEPRNA